MTQPLAGMACAVVGWQSQTSFTEASHFFEHAQGHAECRERVRHFLEENLEPGTLVVSSDIGAIAYAAPSIQFIDTVGLTSRDVLEAREQGRSPEPVLFARNPTVIADTCSGECDVPQRFSAYNWLSAEHYWLTPLPEHEQYFSRLGSGRSLVRCRTPDGLWFGAAQFVRR